MVWTSFGDAPGTSGPTRRLRHGIRWKRRPMIRLNNGFSRTGVREVLLSSFPRHRPHRASRAGDGCRERAGGQSFHRGPLHQEDAARTPGTNYVGTMLLARPCLTNSTAHPILLGGMSCCRSVRPDQAPILERTGQPFPASIFRRPPAGVPLGPMPQRRAAHRSSGVNDQTYADRRHTCGRDPRGGAGW